MIKNKFILIVSEESDPVTDEIFKWLLKLDNSCIVKRINYEDEIINLTIKLPDKEVIITTDDDIIVLNDVHKIWYRRGLINYLKGKDLGDYKGYLSNEFVKFTDGFWNIVDPICCSSFLNLKISKVEMLLCASIVNLKIPKTLYTGLKHELIDFYLLNQRKIITKAIENASFLNQKENQVYGIGTKEVLEADIKDCPDTFFISLFQEKIEKLYEIRTMYYKKSMYSIAILSQENSKTQIDYRNYDNETPNRNVPYKLPEVVENKLIKLMNKLKLDTGSIDLILNTNQEYVFLEVNPFGQFLNVDYIYGGEISKLIAEDILS